MLGEQIFRLNQAKYFILNTNEIVTLSLKYRFWVRVWSKRESLYFTLTEYELSGGILGLLLAHEVCPDLPAVLCCDNQGAYSILKKGSSRSKLARALSATFWNIASATAGALWIEYVRSHLNPSDPVSRMCPRCGPKAIAFEEDCRMVPNMLHEISKSPEALDSARFALPPCTPGFKEGGKCNVCV